MALGTTDLAGIIPALWSKELQAHLDKAHIFAQPGTVVRNYPGSEQLLSYGETIKVNKIGDITVGTYTRYGSISFEELETTGQTLTIDQADYFAFHVDDIDQAQTDPKVLGDAAQRAAYALNDKVDGYLANLLLTSAGSSVTDPLVLSDQNIYKELIRAKVALDRANVPASQRYVIAPPEIAAHLLTASQLVATGAESAQAPTVNGYVARVAGFTVLSSNNQPEGRATYFHAGAMTFIEQVTRTEMFRPENGFRTAVKGLHVYGAKVFEPKMVGVLGQAPTPPEEG